MAHEQHSKQRLLKCFCNCTTLTEEEVENIVLGTIEGFLNNELAKKLFRSFLKIGRTNNASDYPPVLEALDCYELSKKVVIKQTELNEEVYDELIYLCPSFLLEESLREAYEANEVDKQNFGHLANVLNCIMRECKLSIEASGEYTAYRKSLCDKLKNK